MIKYMLLIIGFCFVGCSTKHYVSFYRNSRVYIDVMDSESVKIVRKKYQEQKPYIIDTGVLELKDGNTYSLVLNNKDSINTYTVIILPDYFIWQKDTCERYGLLDRLFPKRIEIKKEIL